MPIWHACAVWLWLHWMVGAQQFAVVRHPVYNGIMRWALLLSARVSCSVNAPLRTLHSGCGARRPAAVAMYLIQLPDTARFCWMLILILVIKPSRTSWSLDVVICCCLFLQGLCVELETPIDGPQACQSVRMVHCQSDRPGQAQLCCL